MPNKLLPEGPFGDHLGYYSLPHDFPVLRVEQVYHRDGAIWPFTVVGRPPQEDTIFGQLIHELTGPVIPTVLPGVDGVHAVDAAGVHPLLLAIGSERYRPFAETQRPQELLTQANAILGQGQLSLAKYLLIANQADDPQLDIHDIAAFLRHMLERVDWTRDLHFQTQTTIDTLDYSGGGLNAGSKVVIAAVGPKRFELATELPATCTCPRASAIRASCCRASWRSKASAIRRPHLNSADVRSVLRIARTIRSPASAGSSSSTTASSSPSRCATSCGSRSRGRTRPPTSTASTPSCTNKHWGCRGPLVIDARLKPHHAPPLVEDPDVTRRVDALAAPGGPLHGII